MKVLKVLKALKALKALMRWTRERLEMPEMPETPETPETPELRSKPRRIAYINNAAGRHRRRFHEGRRENQMTTQTKGVTAKEVSELRQRTGAGMMDCKAALDEAKGDMDAAVELLRKKGVAKADKRAGRTATEGLINSYIHHNGKLGVLVEVNCETDFVARTDDFKNLVKAIAEHIAGSPTPPLAVDKDQIPAEKVESEKRIFAEQVKQSGKPAHLVDKIVEGKLEAFYKDVCLLYQPWVRDDKRTIGKLVKEASAKTGEKVEIRRFVRFQMGEA